jgi:hypothetical protein
MDDLLEIRNVSMVSLMQMDLAAIARKVSKVFIATLKNVSMEKKDARNAENIV